MAPSRERGGQSTIGWPGSIDFADAVQDAMDGALKFGEWLVPPLLPARGLSVLYGPSGSGKTFLLNSLATAVAAGVPWLEGAEAINGGVVYIASEDFFGVIARTIVAADAVQLVGARLPLRFLPNNKNLDDDMFVGDVVNAAKELGSQAGFAVKLVVLDTLAGAYGGASQDDAAKMTVVTNALLKIANKLDCLVLIAHHTGKDQRRGMRGSEVLKDRADTVLALSKKNGRFYAKVEKSRNAAEGQSFTFSTTTHTATVGETTIETLVVRGVRLEDEGNRKAAHLPRDAELILSALRTLETKATRVLQDNWREASIKALGPRKAAALRKAFSASKALLFERGCIDIQGEFVSVRQCENPVS